MAYKSRSESDDFSGTEQVGISTRLLQLGVQRDAEAESL